MLHPPVLFEPSTIGNPTRARSTSTPTPSFPRLQRFAQTSVVKRTILELIAVELLKMMPPALSVHGGGQYQ